MPIEFPPDYVPAIMLRTLIAHQRLDIGNCLCGELRLGESHARHVLDVYERVMALLDVSRSTPEPPESTYWYAPNFPPSEPQTR